MLRGGALIGSCIVARQPSRDEDVMLDGSAVLLPRGIVSAVAAARMVECATDVTSEVPLQRWSVDVPVPEPITSRLRHGGFAEGVSLFDNSCFGISPAEAAAMDPQQRVVQIGRAHV